MGLIFATTAALVLWIVLWALNVGRTGDAFFIAVPPIVLVAAAAHVLRRQRP